MINRINMIKSNQNRLVKRWKKLHKTKGRKESQSFLIEGEHLLQEAVFSNLTIVALIVMKEKWTWFQSKFDYKQINSPVYLLSSSLFSSLMDTKTPQGVAAEVKFPEWEKSEQLTGTTYILLDEIQDPGNLGTIIRTAEATNVDAIWLGKGSVDPTNAKVVRSAMGSSFRLPIFSRNLGQIIPQMQREGIQIISASPRAAKNYYQFQYAKRVAFLLGNEGRGIHREWRALVDDEVVIPMYGPTESLNVSITASILLYERLRQRLITCKGAQHSI